MIEQSGGYRLLPLLSALALAWLSAAPVWAQVPPLGPELSREPIHIEADRMESDQKSEVVLFFGNVEARQGDLLIQAERMTVYYQKPAAAGTAAPPGEETSRAIEKLLASGTIKIVKQNWVATGDQLEFISGERKIVLTGNTRVWQDNNLVTGDRIVLFLDEGKSVVEKNGTGDGGRVKAFFYPEGGTGQKP